MPSESRLEKDKIALSKKPRARDFLLIPLGCLIRSPLILLILTASLGLFGWIAYTGFNWDVLGLAAPKFQDWEVSANFDQISRPSNESWKITYEGKTNSAFSGLIRHITPIREMGFPLLTHDILVTRGDYANPELVRASVSNHRFAWSANGVDSVSGSINLLHAVPQNEEIYRALLTVRKGDWVRITGREIFSIEHFTRQGDLAGTWVDAGCNSILVTQIEFIEPPAE